MSDFLLKYIDIFIMIYKFIYCLNIISKCMCMNENGVLITNPSPIHFQTFSVVYRITSSILSDNDRSRFNTFHLIRLAGEKSSSFCVKKSSICSRDGTDQQISTEKGYNLLNHKVSSISLVELLYALTESLI